MRLQSSDARMLGAFVGFPCTPISTHYSATTAPSAALYSDLDYKSLSTDERAIIAADREIQKLASQLAGQAEIYRALAVENGENLANLELTAQRAGSAERQAEQLRSAVEALRQQVTMANAKLYESNCAAEQLRVKLSERDRAIAALKTAEDSLHQELALLKYILSEVNCAGESQSKTGRQHQPAPEIALAEDRLRNASLENVKLRGQIEQFRGERERIPQLERENTYLQELVSELRMREQYNAANSEALHARLVSEIGSAHTAAKEREEQLQQSNRVLLRENEALQQSRLCAYISRLNAELDQLRSLNEAQQKTICCRDAALKELQEMLKMQTSSVEKLRRYSYQLRTEQQACQAGALSGEAQALDQEERYRCVFTAMQSHLAEQQEYIRAKYAQIDELHREVSRQQMKHSATEQQLSALQSRLLVKSETARACATAKSQLSEALEREKHLLGMIECQKAEIQRLRCSGSIFIQRSQLLLKELHGGSAALRRGAAGPCED